MHPSFATRLNLDLLEQNYERWRKDPDSLDSGWSAFFEGFDLGNLDGKNGAAVAAQVEARRESPLQTRIDALVHAYRILGHTIARVNPLADKRPENPLLTLREFGFSDKDLDHRVSSKFFLDNRQMTLRQMIALLDQIYAGSIGAEFQHIQNTRIRDWVRHRLESRIFAPPPSAEIQVALLRSLLEAETFEVFLHKSYVGQKRFSLQGAEGVMAILDTLLHKCASDGVREICMGMAHRGRLNVLANFLRKSLSVIFTEFTENYVPALVAGDGDVKYHLGYQTVRKLAAGEVEIRLSANPSHLEAVDPVVEGQARARQRLRGDTEHRRKVLPLLIHGDAAFAGQGIVAETLNMSQLAGYSTGGTFHIVVNNQIGFTTLPEDARSSMYATDIAKMIEVPILHVNGEDPLALKFVTEMALDFRQEFGRDFVVDMYCYRKYGHQEVDEPSFTQPDLYARIDKRPSVTQIYKRELLDRGVLTQDDAASLETEFQLRLEMALEYIKALEKQKTGEQAKFKESTADFQSKYSTESKPSASVMPIVTTQKRALLIIRCCISRKNRPAFVFTTVSFRKPPCSDSITATRSIIQTCCVYGRRSSAILSTGRRLLSISSSFPLNQSGSDRAGSFCSCRTATKDKAQNTPAPGLSGFFKPAPKTTSKSAFPPHRRSISTFCVGK